MRRLPPPSVSAFPVLAGEAAGRFKAGLRNTAGSGSSGCLSSSFPSPLTTSVGFLAWAAAASAVSGSFLFAVFFFGKVLAFSLGNGLGLASGDGLALALALALFLGEAFGLPFGFGAGVAACPVGAGGASSSWQIQLDTNDSCQGR